MATLALQMTAVGAEPIVQWATVAGSANDDYPFGIALAPAGVLYLVGGFDGTYSQPKDILYKFDLSGTLIGSQASRGEWIQGVAVDSKGNYYLTGQVWQPTTLGVGRTNDFYLAKYTSTGNLLWERTAGTPTYSKKLYWSQGKAIALDAAGHVYVAGQSTGPDVFGDVTFPAATAGPLLCKYDQDGTLLWVRRAEATPDRWGSGGDAGSIALDGDGNIVTTGYLNNGEANFGGTVVTVAGPFSGDFFVAKYKASGDVQWVRVEYGGRGVAADRQDNIYFNGEVAGNEVMHCGKFTPEGELVWEKIIPGAYGHSVALDGQDEPVFAGMFFGTVQLDDLLVQNDSDNYQDILVCKADAAGKFQWALAGGSSEISGATQVVCDRAGNIYAAGFIRRDPGMLGSLQLNPLFPDDDELDHDVFVARLTDPDAVVPELKIARTGSGVTLSWPASSTGFVLETAIALPATNWSAVPDPAVLDGDQNVVTVEVGSSAKFFRLRKP
jgi:hypothetical protein